MNSDWSQEDAEEFKSLMQGVRQGSEEAAEQLLARYSGHIALVVRRSLNKQMRSQFDSLDFTQAVWASFFAQPAALAELDTPDRLVGYLCRMARNKVVDEFRRLLQTEEHDVRREESLDTYDEGHEKALGSRQPSPSQIALAKELWARLTAGKPVHYREVLRLRKRRMTHKEIARRLGLTERSVRRILRELAPE